MVDGMGTHVIDVATHARVIQFLLTLVMNIITVNFLLSESNPDTFYIYAQLSL